MAQAQKKEVKEQKNIKKDNKKIAKVEKKAAKKVTKVEKKATVKKASTKKTPTMKKLEKKVVKKGIKTNKDIGGVIPRSLAFGVIKESQGFVKKAECPQMVMARLAQKAHLSPVILKAQNKLAENQVKI